MLWKEEENYIGIAYSTIAILKSYSFKIFSETSMARKFWECLFYCLVGLAPRNESCKKIWGSVGNTNVRRWDFRRAENKIAENNKFSKLEMFHIFRIQHATAFQWAKWATLFYRQRLKNIGKKKSKLLLYFWKMWLILEY